MSEERREFNDVRDQKTEDGVKLVNIIATLTLLMIGGFGTWIGTNIAKMQDSISQMITVTSLNKASTVENRSLINEIKQENKEIKGHVGNNKERIISIEGAIRAWRK